METGINQIRALEHKIYFIRGKRVMLDSDLAELYGVFVKRLNEQIRRNIERFPDDFMFRLNINEYTNLKSQFATSSLEHGGRRKLPYAFTEQGVAMLSSVLKSKQAIQVNIQIMRTFTKIRDMLAGNKELREKLEQLEEKYDEQFAVVFKAIKQLLTPPEKYKKPIGFEIK